jgi:hypothetical protein
MRLVAHDTWTRVQPHAEVQPDRGRQNGEIPERHLEGSTALDPTGLRRRHRDSSADGGQAQPEAESGRPHLAADLREHLPVAGASALDR